MTLGSNYSRKQIEDLISQATDPNKVTLICGKHMYVANLRNQPTEGCKDCMMAYLQVWFAKTPPHKRLEELEKLERLVRNMVDLKERGQFDIKLFDHPEVSIERDVDPPKGEN